MRRRTAKLGSGEDSTFATRSNRIELPFPRPCRHGINVLRPIVKCGRIKIGSIRPDKCVNLRVNLDLVEEPYVAQGSKQFASEHRLKVNRLFRVVIKAHAKRVRSNDGEFANTKNRMAGHFLLQR